MTPEMVDPWEVERTLAGVEGLDLADVAELTDAAEVAELADVAAGPDEFPSNAMDEASSPRFAAASEDPSLSPPLAQSAAACANSTAFAVAPEANTLATSVVRASSAKAIASGAVGVPATLTNGGAMPAIFTDSAAGVSRESPAFLAADSRSPGLADPLPLTTESSPVSANPAEAPDSSV
jgi:hypothetical protein